MLVYWGIYRDLLYFKKQTNNLDCGRQWNSYNNCTVLTVSLFIIWCLAFEHNVWERICSCFVLKNVKAYASPLICCWTTVMLSDWLRELRIHNYQGFQSVSCCIISLNIKFNNSSLRHCFVSHQRDCFLHIVIHCNSTYNEWSVYIRRCRPLRIHEIVFLKTVNQLICHQIFKPTITKPSNDIKLSQWQSVDSSDEEFLICFTWNQALQIFRSTYLKENRNAEVKALYVPDLHRGQRWKNDLCSSTDYLRLFTRKGQFTVFVTGSVIFSFIVKLLYFACLVQTNKQTNCICIAHIHKSQFVS